jgi:hypothetical protein
MAAAGVARARTALAWEPPVPDLVSIARSTPLLAAVLFVLTMPLLSIFPTTGPDASWQAGLYMALEGGVQFGHGFVFTYGPLGFLHFPVLYGEGLFLASFAFEIASRYLLVATLLWTARRSLPLPVALAFCYLVLAVGHLDAVLVAVAFLWAFAAVADDSPAFAGPLLATAGGGAAAIELLGKLNFGVSIFALCLVALLALPSRRRNLPLFIGVFLVSLLVLWTIAGQALADLPSYLSNSLQVVSGYSRSMGIDTDPKPHEIALGLAAAGVVFLAAAWATRRDGRVVRAASLLLLAIFTFVCFKQDFVRRGIEVRADFSLMMACAALAVAARMPEGARIPQAALAATLLAPTILLIVWANPAPSFVTALKPQQHLDAFREDLDAISDPSLRQADRETARAAMVGTYSVPASILGRIGGRTVAIEPWEIGVAWADGLDWKPLPVIQDYATYTPALDGLNAAALAGDGPRMILRRDLRGEESTTVTGVDNRYPAWDGPEAKLALLCHYREVSVGGEWELLEKAADRCGPVRGLGVVDGVTGAPVVVPPAPGPGEIVFAKIDRLGLNLTERIETLAYRSPTGWVSFDGGKRWNLETATATDGLILSAPIDVDYRRPFQLAPDTHSFEVGIDGAGPRPITVAFYARQVEPRRASGTPRAANTN